MHEESFTISGILITVNLDAVDDEMIKGLEWWKKVPDLSKPLCPFVSVRSRCIESCGSMIKHLDVYKQCPFKSGVYISSFLKELVEKILESKRKQKVDKEMSHMNI